LPIVIINGPTIQRLDPLSLSDAIDCTAGTLINIMSPPAWTAANLTFQVSLDNITFSNVWRSGKELIVSCGAGRGILVRPDFYLRGMFVKFRSGTSASPVQQTAVRTFAVSIETP
jgi:hypothetical protein